MCKKKVGSKVPILQEGEREEGRTSHTFLFAPAEENGQTFSFPSSSLLLLKSSSRSKLINSYPHHTKAGDGLEEYRMIGGTNLALFFPPSHLDLTCFVILFLRVGGIPSLPPPPPPSPTFLHGEKVSYTTKASFPLHKELLRGFLSSSSPTLSFFPLLSPSPGLTCRNSKQEAATSKKEVGNSQPLNTAR